MSSSYDSDILEWSEHQARLLRQHAEGKPGNTVGPEGGPTETPDWANIIEEVESVGRNQLFTARTLLRRALEHDLKCEAWPSTPYVPNWRAEARRFRSDAAEAYAPSMRQRIDVADLYRKALRILPGSIDGQPPLPVPAACPVTLDELLGDGT